MTQIRLYLRRMLIHAARAVLFRVDEHVLADQPGPWRISIIGSQENDAWELKVFGSNRFERTYLLEGTAAEYEPQAIARIVAKMVPK